MCCTSSRSILCHFAIYIFIEFPVQIIREKGSLGRVRFVPYIQDCFCFVFTTLSRNPPMEPTETDNSSLTEMGEEWFEKLLPVRSSISIKVNWNHVSHGGDIRKDDGRSVGRSEIPKPCALAFCSFPERMTAICFSSMFLILIALGGGRKSPFAAGRMEFYLFELTSP